MRSIVRKTLHSEEPGFVSLAWWGKMFSSFQGAAERGGEDAEPHERSGPHRGCGGGARHQRHQAAPGTQDVKTTRPPSPFLVEHIQSRRPLSETCLSVPLFKSKTLQICIYLLYIL